MKHTPGPLEVAIWDPENDPVEQFRKQMSLGGSTIWCVWAPEHPLTIGKHPRPEHAAVTCITGNGPASEKNALLYAAAPELLEEHRKNLKTLRDLEDVLKNAGFYPDSVSRTAIALSISETEKVIAKAEGNG